MRTFHYIVQNVLTNIAIGNCPEKWDIQYQVVDSMLNDQELNSMIKEHQMLLDRCEQVK